MLLKDKFKSILKESLLSEMSDRMKNEIEIIYRDPNLLCFIPKSQMAANIYGQKTNWCSTTKSGFDMWAKHGLLIRFFFKNGRKIRLTYTFNNHGYNWAREDGYHEFNRANTNPFEVTPYNSNKWDDRKKDIYEYILKIPDQCKNKVLEFINLHKEKYDYCFRDDQFQPKRDNGNRGKFSQLRNYYLPKINDIMNKYNFIHIKMDFDENSQKYVLEYSFKFGLKNNYLLNKETFKESKAYKDRMEELFRTIEKRYQ